MQKKFVYIKIFSAQCMKFFSNMSVHMSSGEIICNHLCERAVCQQHRLLIELNHHQNEYDIKKERKRKHKKTSLRKWILQYKFSIAIFIQKRSSFKI